jgi:plasmid stability protein
MAEVLVRELEEAVVERLARRAATAGIPLDEQVRRVLRGAAGSNEGRPPEEELLAIMARSRAMTPPGPRTLAEDLIREDRDSR